MFPTRNLREAVRFSLSPGPTDVCFIVNDSNVEHSAIYILHTRPAEDTDSMHAGSFRDNLISPVRQVRTRNLNIYKRRGESTNSTIELVTTEMKYVHTLQVGCVPLTRRFS